MTRRDLMKLTASAIGAVIFAPFLGSAQGRAAATVAAKAAPAGPWRMIAWVEKEFTDELGRRCEGWVDHTGFCAVYQDQETLELRRNAVRLDRHPDVRDNYRDNRAYAKNLLRIWCDDLNLHWPPDVWRRATQQYWIYDQHGKLVGWHYDAQWPDHSYGGYLALGHGAVEVKSR
jgi:hypothetical protein